MLDMIPYELSSAPEDRERHDFLSLRPLTSNMAYNLAGELYGIAHETRMTIPIPDELERTDTSYMSYLQEAQEYTRLILAMREKVLLYAKRAREGLKPIEPPEDEVEF